MLLDDQDLDNDILDAINCSNYYDPVEFHNNQNSRLNNSKISMFNINCQSLKANWDGFHSLISTLHSPHFKFDIIGITELFKIPENMEYKLDGYHKLQFKSREIADSDRGGVGLFINETFEYEPRKDLSVFIPHVFESLFFEIKPHVKSKPLLIGIIYRPNTAPLADLDVFIHTLSDISNIISSENKKSVLMGDFNINLLKYNVHQKTTDFLDNLISQGFLPVITRPTRVTHHSATLIDHIFTNSHNINSSSGIIISDEVADHFGTYYIIKDYRQNHQPLEILSRGINERGINLLNTTLTDEDFSQVLNEPDPNVAYENFITIYKKHFDDIFPIKKITLSKKYIKQHAWMTNGLITSSIQKQRLYKRKLKNPSPQNIEIYKTYLKMYNKTLRVSKAKYYKESLTRYKNNVKQTWKILNQIIHKNTDKSNLPNTFKHNNVDISDKTSIANKFNEYFVSIGKTLNDKIKKTQVNFSQYIQQNHPHSMFFDPIEINDLFKAASKIKAKNSVGFDDISSKIMKQTLTPISHPLLHIFNRSMQTGIFPTSMKIAKVVPIFKNGNNQHFDNYRPISVLPAFSKLLEKIIATKLCKFLESHQILYKHQYGFRQKHSTIHPVIHLLKHISEANDLPTKDFTISLFLDLSKAFDTVNHEILIKKLDLYGIRGVCRDWFESYLQNRSQYVEVNGIKSDLKHIQMGVPQGSILGPILFIIYINDIYKSTSMNILSYADDTTVYISGNNIQSLVDTINKELAKIHTWLCTNCLTLNTSKTNLMIFSPTNKEYSLANHPIVIKDQIIKECGSLKEDKSVKFLGIHLDQNLTWSHHIQHISSKISKNLYIMNRVKHFLPHHSLKSLYYTMIDPYMTNGISVWGNSISINKINTLQKRAMRIINKKRYNSHTEPLFKSENILNLTDLYEYHVLLFMYDLKHGKLPMSFNDFVVTNRIYRDRTTRQNDLFHLNCPRTNFSKRLPNHSFPRIWNSKTKDIIDIDNRLKFKEQCKLFFLQKYSDNVKCNNIFCKDCYTN